MLDDQKKMVSTSNTNEGNPLDTMDPGKLDHSTSPENKLTEWKREPTIGELKGDLEYASPETRDQKANVEGWLALRNATGAESGRKSSNPGRSSVQPKLIRKHNEWRYPALSEPFLNSDRMFQIRPRTHEDRASSEQNQMLLNWQFDTKIDKVDFIDRFVRKTVDEGTCVVRVGWERKTEKVLVEKPVYAYYPLQDPQQVQVLQQAAQLYQTDRDNFENRQDVTDDLRASVEYFLEKGIPVYAEETGMEEVHEERITYNQPSLKIVDVANFFIDPSCEGEWQNAQYMIHTYESTKSDLKKRKLYKNLDKVNWGSNAIAAQAGNPDHESNTPLSDTRTNTDKAKVLVYEYWGLYDIHGDGEMVPIVATFVGDTIIQLAENPFPDRRPPFIIVPYMPILGSTYGEADASILQDNQRVLGAVTRGTIDLLGRSANAQTGYAKGFLDPVNRKRFTSGEDFEYNPNSDPAMAVRQMTYPEIPQSALVIMDAQNREAEGLSGVKSFSAGITGDSYGQVARGISGALDAAGQREMSILRRLAEGMRQIGRKIISMNAKFLEDHEVVRVTNQEFVEIKRRDLPGEFDLIVDISTAQVDQQKAEDLGFMLQTIGPEMDPGLQQMILADIADLKRMPDLAQRLRSYQPQPDPLAEELKRLQIEELKAKIALDLARAKQAEAMAENKALDTELEATGTKHQRQVEAQGAQARGNRDLKVSEALLKGESAPQNIEAAVGFNKLTEESDRMQASQNATPFQPLVPPMGNPEPLAPLQSAQQPPMVNPAQQLALPQ